MTALPGVVVLGDQRAQRGRVEQRDVAVGDQHGALGVRGQRGDPARDGVPGAAPAVLDGGADLPAELGADLLAVGADLLAPVADDDDEVLGGGAGGGVQGVPEQAAPADRVEHLGRGRAHPGALSRGQDDDRGGGRRHRLFSLLDSSGAVAAR